MTSFFTYGGYFGWRRLVFDEDYEVDHDVDDDVDRTADIGRRRRVATIVGDVVLLRLVGTSGGDVIIKASM